MNYGERSLSFHEQLYGKTGNEMLSFDSIFRGILETKAKQIERRTRFAAARPLADVASEQRTHGILPSPFNATVASIVGVALAAAFSQN